MHNFGIFMINRYAKFHILPCWFGNYHHQTKYEISPGLCVVSLIKSVPIGWAPEPVSTHRREKSVLDGKWIPSVQPAAHSYNELAIPVPKRTVEIAIS